MAQRVRAFSLLEVVFAIGLVMSAALVIFSLLPVGLQSLGETSRQIVQTEIFETVGAEFTATPYRELSSFQASRFPVYFDIEGNEVSASGNAIFTVRCDPPVADASGELTRMTVSIGYHRDPRGSATGGEVSKRTFLLVDRGY